MRQTCVSKLWLQDLGPYLLYADRALAYLAAIGLVPVKAAQVSFRRDAGAVLCKQAAMSEAALLQAVFAHAARLLRSRPSHSSQKFGKSVLVLHAFADALQQAAEDAHPSQPEAPYLAATMVGPEHQALCSVSASLSRRPEGC